MLDFQMIVDGRPRETAATLAVRNPANGEVAAHCPAGAREDLDAAVAAARAAFPEWSARPWRDRTAAVRAVADKMELRLAELAQLVSMEVGKPLEGFANKGGKFEAGAAVAWARATAGLELPVKVLSETETNRVELHHKPIGVVCSITPWNFPLMIAIWHTIPALCAGNTVVIKPSSLTPLATLRFVEIANEVLPRGVLNIVTGEGGLGRAMSSHSGVDKIVFTGSTPTGRSIMGGAAQTLKRLTLELGGNDAGIVLPDVDPAAIAMKVFGGAMINCGQTCGAMKRLYVHDAVYEPMCAALAAVASKMRLGGCEEEGVDFGPLQNEAQLAFVEELARDAEARGGRFLTGGTKRLNRPGYFFPITLVADLADGTRLVDEEQFGPILPIIRYRDVDDAIRRANDNPNGLGGSVWSADIARATALARRLECGAAWVNQHGVIAPHIPFGGVKQSGFGVEFGVEGLAENTVLQTVNIAKG